MKEDKYCPCCGRHCSLDAPGCERGREYAARGEGSEDGEREWRGDRCKRDTNRSEEFKKLYDGMNVYNKLIINIRDVGHIMRALYENDSQNRILMIVNERGTITQCELTDHLGIQPGSASEVIGKLERAGLIVREASTADRRTSEIKLTELGKLKAEQAVVQRENRHVEMFKCLSDEDRSQLLLLLEKLNNDWRDRYSDRVFRRHGECGHGRSEDGGCGRGHGGRHGCHRRGKECRGHGHGDESGNFDNGRSEGSEE